MNKYDELKDQHTSLIPLRPLICTIESGMRVWANQLSPELSRGYACIYIGRLCTLLGNKPGDTEEYVKLHWNILHSTAKEVAADLELHFAPLHIKEDDA